MAVICEQQTCPITLLTQWWVLGEALHTHRFSRDHDDDGSISRLQALGVVFKLFARTAVDFFFKLSKLASNVGSVTVQHRSIALGDLTRVVQDDDLNDNKRVKTFLKPTK